MNIQTFVSELRKAAPGLTELQKVGRSVTSATRFINSYFGFRCAQGMSQSVTHSDLAFWDLRQIEIGMLAFLQPPIDSPSRCIGCVEGDPLVILPTEEIAVVEFGTSSHVLWMVARDLPRMFDALLVAAQFFAKRATKTIDLKDVTAAKSASMQCAISAGGDGFLSFYEMLLGLP